MCLVSKQVPQPQEGSRKVNIGGGGRRERRKTKRRRWRSDGSCPGCWSRRIGRRCARARGGSLE
eukprot:4573956-Pyramimonas_sp.AAC.1